MTIGFGSMLAPASNATVTPQRPSAPASAPDSLPAPTSDIASPTSPLPHLSDADESLLSQYLSLNFNLDSLAAESKLPQLHLVRWLNPPHILEYLKAVDLLRARQTAAEDLADRRGAIDTLKHVQSASEDLVERRRAANAILRTLNLRRALGPHPRSSDPGPSSSTTDFPDARHFDNAEYVPQDTPRRRRRSHPTSDLPHPTSLPSPSDDARETLLNVLEALCDHHDETGLATLHAHCHTGAVIDGEPVPHDLADFLDDIDDDTAERLKLKTYIPGAEADPGPTTVRFEEFQFCTEGPFTLADVTLRRDNPESPFLIAKVDFHRQNQDPISDPTPEDENTS